jgi:hypothetical protein
LVPSDAPDRYIEQGLDITADGAKLMKARSFAQSSVEHLGWHEIAAQVETIFERAIDMA